MIIMLITRFKNNPLALANGRGRYVTPIPERGKRIRW